MALARSAVLVAELTERLGSGRASDPRGGTTEERAIGLGVVAAWRETIVTRVEVGAARVLERVKVVDPSFPTWPALPVALADTIVPDFPLVNQELHHV